MKRRGKMIMLLTAAGILATTAMAGAAGLTSKVSGLLRKDVKVSVNGTVTGMEPVFINGKAYLPAREAVAELGYELTWNGKDKRLDLRDPETVLMNSGVVEKVTDNADGSVTFEFVGKSLTGNGGRVILRADANTVIEDAGGKAVAIQAIHKGMHATVEYGPVVTDSIPPTAYASKVVTGPVRLIREDVIREVQIADGDARIVFGTGEGAGFTPDLVLNLGKETSVVNAQGQSRPWTDLKVGVKVRAYYGPALMKSMPPQSPADTLVILDGTSSVK